MITTIFSKSNPFNYVVVTLVLVICFFLYQNKIADAFASVEVIFQKAGLLILLIGSLFISNFITKKNGLSKDNTFPFLFFFSFLILFPTTLGNTNLIISNFFNSFGTPKIDFDAVINNPKRKNF